jgi:hypothetical protein
MTKRRLFGSASLRLKLLAAMHAWGFKTAAESIHDSAHWTIQHTILGEIVACGMLYATPNWHEMRCRTNGCWDEEAMVSPYHPTNECVKKRTDVHRPDTWLRLW